MSEGSIVGGVLAKGASVYVVVVRSGAGRRLPHGPSGPDGKAPPLAHARVCVRARERR